MEVAAFKELIVMFCPLEVNRYIYRSSNIKICSIKFKTAEIVIIGFRWLMIVNKFKIEILSRFALFNVN